MRIASESEIQSTKWDGEAIIADTLQRGPEIQVSSSDDSWRFSRWRQFAPIASREGRSYLSGARRDAFPS